MPERTPPTDLRVLPLTKPRYKERGALCKLTPIPEYTGPLCSCGPLYCATCAACTGDPEAHDLHVCLYFGDRS